MATQAVTSVTCPNCRTRFSAPIEQIVDAQTNPEAKTRLLSGQINVVVCPQCGSGGALNAPFLYHDADLDLALIYLPMGLGVTDLERQKTIGDLTNRLMQRLPPEARKGYLLQPQTFFSIKSLVDALLERDEETRKMLDFQRRKMELFDQLRQIDPDDSLAVAVFCGDNDTELDVAFFQLLDMMIELLDDPQAAAERDRLLRHRATVLEKSSTGRSFQAQQAAMEALAAKPTQETLIDQLVLAQDIQVRRALVAMGRQFLDYTFFQTLTSRIDAAGSAGDTATRERLLALRKEVQEIRDQVDASSLAVMSARANLIRDIMLAGDPRAKVLEHLYEVDDVFFGVLNANVRQAEAEGRKDLVEALRAVGDVVLGVLNETAPPEVKLMGRLADAESNEQIDQLLQAERDHLSEEFLEFVESTAEEMDRLKRPANAERLRYAAQQIKEMAAA